MKFKSANRLSTLTIYYKLLIVLSYETQSSTTLRFVNENIRIEGESRGSEC
jgi:hypothetical protein